MQFQSKRALDKEEAKKGHICDRRNAKWNTKIAKVRVLFN
jgi:hypothetical protein